MHTLRYTEASSRCYSCLIISLNLCPQGLGMWSGGRKNGESTFQRQAGKANMPACSLSGAHLLQFFRIPLCPQLSDLRLVPSEASEKLGLAILTVAYFCISSNLSQDTTSLGSFPHSPFLFSFLVTEMQSLSLESEKHFRKWSRS